MDQLGSKLFLSCDLVGSTSHKQSAGSTDHWIPDFLRFYYDFPARVRENLVDQSLVSGLQFWKAVGDELLFTLQINHETDVFEVVNAWVAAMLQYEKELAEKNTEEKAFKNKMKMKGGAFIATFPDPDYNVVVPTMPMALDSERDVLVRNEEMKKSDVDAGSRLVDYLGPSIDTGFRVIAACSQRYFTLSLEVAWAMAYHHLHHDRQETIAGLTLLQEQTLKGVWDGRAYPVFALDRQHEDTIVSHLAKVRGSNGISLMEVDRLAAACVADPHWPSRVYFPASSYSAFTDLQAHLEKQQQKLDTMTDKSGESMEEFTSESEVTDENQRDASSMDVGTIKSVTS